MWRLSDWVILFFSLKMGHNNTTDLLHFKLGSSNHQAMDRMAIAFFFCMLSIVMVVVLYLCFWYKVERSFSKDINRNKIKVTWILSNSLLISISQILEREVDSLTSKMLWLEGSMAVAECEDRVSK